MTIYFIYGNFTYVHTVFHICIWVLPLHFRKKYSFFFEVKDLRPARNLITMSDSGTNHSSEAILNELINLWIRLIRLQQFTTHWFNDPGWSSLKSLNWSCLTQNEPTRSNMILRAQVFRLIKIRNNLRQSSNLFKMYPIYVTGALDPSLLVGESGIWNKTINNKELIDLCFYF